MEWPVADASLATNLACSTCAIDFKVNVAGKATIAYSRGAASYAWK